MKKIDSHQHFWLYDAEKHSWISDQMEVLKRNFMPPELKKEMNTVGIEGCIAVQADQTESETRFLLSLADKYDYVKGVVGWLDIRADDFEKKLDQYSEHTTLKGLRHIVQDEPDDRFLLQPDVLQGIKTLGRYNLTFDILIYARQLPAAVEFAFRFPEQKFVLDHIAKPEIRQQNVDDWAKGIRKLARHPRMHCKVSGMVTEADWKQWKADDFKPYLDVVFDAFSADKLMFGSDWPVCTLAADYKEVFQLLDDYIRPLPKEEQHMIWGENTQRFYNL